jgi:hypothetical protein
MHGAQLSAVVHALAGAVALTIEEPSSNTLATGKGFTVAYACGGVPCADAKYILKVFAWEPPTTQQIDSKAH